MQKTYKITLVLLLLMSISVEAKKFKIEVTEEGVDTNFPFSLDDMNTTIIELGYYSNKYDEIENFNKGKSRKADKVDENNIAISAKYLISTRSKTKLFLGLEYERFKRDNEQIGYHKKGDEHIPFNNFIKLTGTKFNILSEAVYKDVEDSNKFEIFLRGTITPKTKLDIKQNTKIFPNLTTGGELDSKATFDLSYKIESELQWSIGDRYIGDWNIGEFFNIGVGASYAFMPYDYQLKVINKKKDGYIEKNLVYDEKTIEYFLKIRINHWLSDDILPTVGYRKIKTKYSNKNDNVKSITDENRGHIFVGIEKWF